MTIDRDSARALIAEARGAAVGHRYLGGEAHEHDASRYDRLADALEALSTAVPVEGDPPTQPVALDDPVDELVAAVERLEAWLDSRLGDVLIYPNDVRVVLDALPVEGEVEWEYGCRSGAHRQPVVLDPMLDKPEDHEWDCPSPAIVRRRKAGPWEVAP